MAGPDLVRTLERLAAALDVTAPSAPSAPQEDPRERRRREKEEKRLRKRQEKYENASVLKGGVQLVAALAFVLFAVVRPQFWWLIFVALGIGGDGAAEISMALDKKKKLEAGAPAVKTPDVLPAPTHEVDRLCDTLLADLKASPESVREFLRNPEQTVQSLRVTAKALDVRRQELIAEGADKRLVELKTQRESLIARRDASSDAQAKAKLDGAVKSLDGQEAALKQLAAVGERVDGEYTALLVLLQELKTRVSVAKSASSGTELDGLQQNVQRLNLELEAITESLQAAGMQPIDANVGGAQATHAPNDRVSTGS